MDNEATRNLVKIYVNEKYQKSAEQISKRLNDIVDIFERHGVTDPTDADFENIIKPEITATKGKKGEQASASTVQAYLRVGKEFYQWLKMRGDNRMTENEISNVEEQNAVTNMEQTDTLPEASINHEAKNEELNAVENESNSENLSFNNNEDMITSQDTQEHLDNANIEQITPEESNNTESINTQEAHSENEITASEKSTEQSGEAKTTNPSSLEKKKGGRKVSTNRDTRFTLYMTADVLRDMNTLAKYDNSTITDLMNNLLISYINDRREDIVYMEDFERMKEEREARKKAR